MYNHDSHIYGYEDGELMFNDIALSIYNIYDVDLTREADEIYVKNLFKNKEYFKIVIGSICYYKGV